MKPILYISDDNARFAQLKQAVEGICKVQQLSPGEVGEIQSFSAVVWDTSRDSSSDSRTLCRMEIECALYAIPLLFVRQEEGRQTPGVGCIPNIASILELPFNRRRIIETIERQLPGCRELIQTIFTDHLLAATSKVLNLASNTDASCTDIRHDQGFQWPAESTGFMSLSGAVEGAVAISFPYDLAAEVAIGMSGLKRSELSDSDIEEVSGEIVNQIAGQARTDLWLPEFRIDITLPLAINKACAGSNENDDGWTIASLQSDDHTFYLQVFIKEVHPTPAATTERKPDSKPPCPVAD